MYRSLRVFMHFIAACIDGICPSVCRPIHPSTFRDRRPVFLLYLSDSVGQSILLDSCIAVDQHMFRHWLHSQNHTHEWCSHVLSNHQHTGIPLDLNNFHYFDMEESTQEWCSQILSNHQHTGIPLDLNNSPLF
jgi:hypothetical protein